MACETFSRTPVRGAPDSRHAFIRFFLLFFHFLIPSSTFLSIRARMPIIMTTSHVAVSLRLFSSSALFLILLDILFPFDMHWAFFFSVYIRRPVTIFLEPSDSGWFYCWLDIGKRFLNLLFFFSLLSRCMLCSVTSSMWPGNPGWGVLVD